MNTNGKNGQAIGHAYGQPMAEPMARYGTVRNGTVHRQDSDENSSVPDAVGAVDNPKTGVQHVEFDLPKPVWFELAGIAEKHDTTVAALIADAIKNTVTAEQQRLARYRSRRKQIVELVQQGHTDAVICERLGETRAYVGDVRRAARLNANRPGMATHQKETA